MQQFKIMMISLFTDIDVYGYGGNSGYQSTNRELFFFVFDISKQLFDVKCWQRGIATETLMCYQ